MRLRAEFTLFRRTLKSGKVVWYYHAYDENNKRLTFSTGHTGKSRAQAYVLDLLKQGRLIPDHALRNTTFEELAKPFWLWGECPYVTDKIRRGGEYSRSLCDSNRKSMEKHILPIFGPKRVTTITMRMVNDWLLALPGAAKISRSTANKMLAILRTMLAEAVHRGIITANPAAAVKPLVEKANARDAFTLEEATRLLSDPDKWGNILSYTASLLCAHTGLRAGEIRALRLQDVHEDHIVVSHSWDETYGMKSTKSGNTRVVPLTPMLHEALMVLAPDGPEGFLFSLDGKKPMSGRVLTNSLYRKMREIGISEEERQERGLSFHSWRHFFNSQLIASGVGGEITRAVVGHESKAMTDHYLHLKAGDLGRVLEVQQDLLTSPPAQSPSGSTGP